MRVERSIAWCATAAALAFVACGPPPMEGVGVSTGGASGPPPAPSASVGPPPWVHAAKVKSWPRANAKRFPSNGHLFGRYDADVHVNAIAAEAYGKIAPGVSLPKGSIVAEVLVARDGTPGPTFAMEKEDDGWSYLEVDANGRLVRKGRLAPCVDCHAYVASQDEVFGVPLNGR